MRVYFLLIFYFSYFVLFFQPAFIDAGTIPHNKASAKKCAWDNCFDWDKDDEIIKVHILAHTHDDMGWLKTADQYYTGANHLNYAVGVQYIFNTVISELLEDPEKKFVYAETGFLQRYLEDYGPKQLEKIKKLVSETGQLELIGGGWVQPDEGASHYYELIDQYTLGLRTLNETFGECGLPRTAWQIDPFGHSREHASLLSLMGFESLYFSRQHYLELEERIKNKTLEFMWKSSDELGTSIFTGTFARGTYGPPAEFCFDVLCQDDPIIDNPKLEDYNVHYMAKKFTDIVKKQVSSQMHNHALMTMGGDFQFSNANQDFTNLDRLIKAINANSTYKLQLFYSTVSCYTEAVRASVKEEWSVKDTDFFPYATQNNGYWTGYFTSKPALKLVIRQSSALLQLMRELNVFSMREDFSTAEEDVLERAIALSIHHDGVTGTAKEFVTRDYEYRLFNGQNVAEIAISAAFQKLARKNNKKGSLESTLPPVQSFCGLLNETVCELTRNHKSFVVTIFNGNSHPLDSYLIKLPVSNLTNAKVLDSTGKKVVSSAISKTFVPGTQLEYQSEMAPEELSFLANVPPLGFSSYFVGESDDSIPRAEESKSANEKENYTISNNLIELWFDESSGLLSKFVDKKRNKIFDLSQKFLYYVGTIMSGAYVFSPEGDEAFPLEGNSKVLIEFVRNGLYEEARQIISPYASQVVRLLPNKAFVEFDFIVGPLPKNFSCIKTHELITRYSIADFNSQSVFKTDSNGRQLMTRERNHSRDFEFQRNQWIAGNYYPVNSRILIEDGDSRLTILTDRSQGGSSLRDGEIELMLHRRAFYDDHLGVDENLDEGGVDGRGLVVRGTHRLLIEAISAENDDESDAKPAHRHMAFEVFHRPIISFSTLENENFEFNVQYYRNHFTTWYSFLEDELKTVWRNSLPPQINLLTLKWLSADILLLRFEHIYQNGENPQLSQSVSFDIQDLFGGKMNVVDVEELMLAANQAVKPATFIRKTSRPQSNSYHGEKWSFVDGKLKPFTKPVANSESCTDCQISDAAASRSHRLKEKLAANLKRRSSYDGKGEGIAYQQIAKPSKSFETVLSSTVSKNDDDSDDSKLWNDSRRRPFAKQTEEGEADDDAGFFVEMKPMEIRTFKVRVHKPSSV